MGSNLKHFIKILCLAFLALGTATLSFAVAANDLPLAAGSPLVGFSFDDRPLLLPVQRNFQMAMLTASTELGRSCGKMESYGWRMKQSEQQRVDQIFNNTVDRLRGLGYSIESQTPASISHDITMFTADRTDRHFVFMWSAGEIGLVMVLCESSPSSFSGHTAIAAPVQVFPQMNDVLKSSLEAPLRTGNHPAIGARFSPVGNWVGGYTCGQGYMGGTLRITHMKGEDFDGVFRFYPTRKNPYAPAGRYTVYGQYDRESQRILINPGKWLERPKGFENTIMVGSFDPIARIFSAYFQGVLGCTSFEAKLATEDYDALPGTSAHKKKKHKKKAVKQLTSTQPIQTKELTPVAPAPAPVPEQVPAPAPVVSPVAAAPVTPGITTPPALPAPAAPTGADAAPAAIMLSAPSSAPAPSPAPPPSLPANASPPVPATPSASAPVSPAVTVPTLPVAPTPPTPSAAPAQIAPAAAPSSAPPVINNPVPAPAAAATPNP